MEGGVVTHGFLAFCSWPALPSDAQCDADHTTNSHHDRFWAENIAVLAASPAVDRLVEAAPVRLPFNFRAHRKIDEEPGSVPQFARTQGLRRV